MEDPQVIDAEVVPENETPPESPPPQQSQELAVATRPQGSTALIVADSAKEKRDIAAEIATTLDDVIRQQGLRTKMGSRKKVAADGTEQWVDSYHVNVEGWQTLATFLDLAVVPVWTRQVNDPTTGQPRRVTFPVKVTRNKGQGQNRVTTTEEYEVDGFDWEARVEVFKDGSLIAGAEAMVSRSEDSWKTRDDHALRSMAQTRATGKAIAGAARWIVALAGYSATPAEEMPDAPTAAAQGGVELPEWAQPASDELTKVAKKAIQYLTSSDNGAAAAAWGELLPGENSPMPRLVAQAIVKIATLVHRRESAAPQQAAEQPDEAAQPETAMPAPGTVFVQGEKVPESLVDRATIVSVEAAQRMCQCEGGFAAAEKNPGLQSDDCPIRNHGIPF